MRASPLSSACSLLMCCCYNMKLKVSEDTGSILMIEQLQHALF